MSLMMLFRGRRRQSVVGMDRTAIFRGHSEVYGPYSVTSEWERKMALTIGSSLEIRRWYCYPCEILVKPSPSRQHGNVSSRDQEGD